VTLEHLAQILERVELNLPHSLPSNTNLIANLLKRCAPVTVQTETPLDNGALLHAELANPVIHNVMHILSLSASRWLAGALCVQAVDRMGAIVVTPTSA
jgi:hypothetical protein